MNFFSFKGKRDIHRIYVSHTLHETILSIVNVYIPIFLLTLGFSLSKTVAFFIVLHGSGLLFTVLVCPSLIRRWGLVKILKIYYPIEICFFILLNFLSVLPSFFWVIAIMGGLATFSYWIPINMLLIKHSKTEKMGSDLANFFAFPKIFGIIGPLISALLIPFIGFWPVFALVVVGLILSYLPLINISKSAIASEFNFKISKAWDKLKERKMLFALECFNAIIEESEWWWGVFVFLIIGTLQAPGIVGSIEALGAAAFTVIAGKYANKSAKILVPVASIFLVIIWFWRLFIENAFPAYMITLVAAFTMTLFSISYFSLIYRTVKNQKEEEYFILREIPIVLGRLILFSFILMTLANLRLFFVLPICATIILIITFYYKRNVLVT